MKTSTPCGYLAAILAGGGLALFAGANLAAADTFIVDTNQSSLTISGSALGATLVAQGAGSMTAAYSGTILATQAGGTILFPGGSSITALDSGNWKPPVGGGTGSAPANYGVKFSLLLGLENVVASVHSILLDVTSPGITVTGGQFNVTNLTFSFPPTATSTLDYRETGLLTNSSGSAPLTGGSPNNTVANATLITAGSQQTLTIPVNTQRTFTLVSSNDTTINLVGQIVAVRTIPLPVTIQSITVNTQVVTLNWQSPAGQFFEVQSTVDFQNWQTAASNVTAASTAYSWSGTNPAATSFYRLAQ